MTKAIKWFAVQAAVFATGVTLGCLSAVKTTPALLYDYFLGLADGEISVLTGTAMISAGLLWSVLFFSVFFKFGAATIALSVGARGFVDGYAVTAILRILGIRGIGLCFLDILGAPTVVAIAAVFMCMMTAKEKSTASYLLVGGASLLIMLALAGVTSLMSGALVVSVMDRITL